MTLKNKEKVSPEAIDETICEDVQPICETVKAVVSENTVSTTEPVVEKSGVWVYIGPNIRGIVTNGGIFVGTKSEVLKRLPDGWRKYPKIERLLVSDGAVARAKEQIYEGKGGISTAYKEVAASIQNAAEMEAH